ncbi:cleavage stimulation factor subunit 3 [Pelomyxa schiedti]|nr:cleavage stimulation factor subunit 3 [Pelomyxa schiedti]
MDYEEEEDEALPSGSVATTNTSSNNVVTTTNAVAPSTVAATPPPMQVVSPGGRQQFASTSSFIQRLLGPRGAPQPKQTVALPPTLLNIKASPQDHRTPSTPTPTPTFTTTPSRSPQGPQLNATPKQITATKPQGGQSTIVQNRQPAPQQVHSLSNPPPTQTPPLTPDTAQVIQKQSNELQQVKPKPPPRGLQQPATQSPSGNQRTLQKPPPNQVKQVAKPVAKLSPSQQQANAPQTPTQIQAQLHPRPQQHPQVPLQTQTQTQTQPQTQAQAQPQPQMQPQAPPPQTQTQLQLRAQLQAQPQPPLQPQQQPQTPLQPQQQTLPQPQTLLQPHQQVTPAEQTQLQIEQPVLASPTKTEPNNSSSTSSTCLQNVERQAIKQEVEQNNETLAQPIAESQLQAAPANLSQAQTLPNPTTQSTTPSTHPPTESPSIPPLLNPTEIVRSIPHISKPSVEFQKAEEEILTDIYDSEAWIILLRELANASTSALSSGYSTFLKVFPTSGKYWKTLIDLELREKNFEKVDEIFKMCLLQCPFVDLWKAYLQYIKLLTLDKPTAREELSKAYEFALQHIGYDIGATLIWLEYLEHLKSEKPTTQREEGNKIVLVRKTYHRALRVPMHGLETVWHDYEAWEGTFNPMMVNRMTEEHSPSYQAAKATYRDRKALMDGISRNILPRPPRGLDKENHQVQLWKKLIAFEKSNPQRLNETEQVAGRVTFTYNQCLLSLYHYPEMWIDAATYQEERANIPEASVFYERSTIAVPNCTLLYFLHADMLEAHKKIAEARAVYEKLMTISSDPLVFIQFQRFAHRAEGMQAARKVFLKARQSPGCTFHVYVASALLEYFVNKDTIVARKIFEFGLNQFMHEPGYIREYFNFLCHLNEENNIRSLFERVLSSMPKDKAYETWNLFISFEKICGDLESLNKLEHRQLLTYPEIDQGMIHRFVSRYRYLDLLPCSQGIIESFGKEHASDSISTSRTSGTSQAPFRDPKHLARPNLSLLIPYPPPEPSLTDLPPAVANLLHILPSAASYTGPIVNIDQLLQTLSDRKRGRQEEEEESQPAATTASPSTANRPPLNDLYRNRQAAKYQRIG